MKMQYDYSPESLFHGLHHCKPQIGMPHIAEVLLASGGICARRGGRDGAFDERAIPVRGRAVCPHSAVNAQVECSTMVARRGRLALPCGCAGRGALGECTLVLARRSASLPWRRLSIIVNKNASNEQNADKIVTVLNKFFIMQKGARWRKGQR